MGILFLIIAPFFFFAHQQGYGVALSVPSASHESLMISKPQVQAVFTMALVCPEHEPVYNDALEIQYLLNHTGLFDVSLITSPAGSQLFPVTKQDITQYLHKGFSSVLFVQQEDKALCWRLYDTGRADMLIGKKVEGASAALMPRIVADKIYSYLFNKPSYLLSKIAYVKKTPTLSQKKRTALCVMDPVRAVSDVVLYDNRTLVAPQWGQSAQDSALFLYVSECTPRNVRLLGVDLTGAVWSVLDADGTYVGLAQKDFSTYVYVRSGVIWMYAYDKGAKKGTHKRLTSLDSTCACPGLTLSGDIIYSSNNKIYRCNAADGTHSLLPIDGTCIAPDVHKLSDRIVFSRAVNGVYQLHVTDTLGKKVKQLTYSAGNKSDACWSPCGNYVAYVRTQRGNEQIVMFNCVTSVETVLTPEHERCGYPCWSANSVHLYT